MKKGERKLHIQVLPIYHLYGPDNEHIENETLEDFLKENTTVSGLHVLSDKKLTLTKTYRGENPLGEKCEEYGTTYHKTVCGTKKQIDEIIKSVKVLGTYLD